MIRAAVLLAVVACCGGCMVLSHDSYFTPSSSADHALRSPFPGNPWNSFAVFGSASDIISFEQQGVRLGLSVRNSACSFAWIGPVFLPLIPIRAAEELDTSQLRIWLAVVPETDLDVRLNQLRVWLPDDSAPIPPGGVYVPLVAAVDKDLVDEPQHVPGGDSASWYLDFALPAAGQATSFDLEVRGITTAEGPLAPILVRFSHVRGWRVISLP